MISNLPTLFKQQNIFSDVLALQEVRRSGSGCLDFETEELLGWRLIWFGFKHKAQAGVAIVIAPHVELVECHNHLAGRIMSARIIVHGLHLAITNVYSPTDVSSESSKNSFYSEVCKALAVLKPHNKFKSIVLGDFNATIGMASKNSGGWDNVLGFNNSNRVETNDNGDRMLNMCSDHGLQIMNSIFRSKRIHRGTWLNPATKVKKRIDYILTRNLVSKFATSCRVYNGASKLFDTDHFLLVMTLDIPALKLQQVLSRLKIPKVKPKLDLSVLRNDPNIQKTYSDTLDSKLVSINLPSDINDLCQHITSTVTSSLESVCPLVSVQKIKEPWEDDELLKMIQNLRTSSGPELKQLQKNIKSKRIELKQKYYGEKAASINTASEARKVEMEFRLAKQFSMHKKSTKNRIPNEKLTEHFKNHFAARTIPLPTELENPENFPFLKDSPIVIDESPPTADEINDACKTFKNNKSSGTDKMPAEGLKYQESKKLTSALLLLFTLIWSLVSVPQTWLESSITCLFKKGIRSLAENYRALCIGANLSKLLPRIILQRLNKSYESNISNTQFGFRKGRSTCDAIHVVKQTIEKHDGMLVAIFIDLTAAYDHIPRDFLFRVLSFRTGAKLLIKLLKKIYEGTTAYIAGSKIKFDILVGCRQGGLESPTCFNYYFDFVLKVCADAIDKEFPDGWGVSFDYRVPNECTNRTQRASSKAHGIHLIKWLLYADDLVLFCTSIEQAQRILEIINDTCTRFGLTISFKKTKSMIFRDVEKSSCKSVIKIGDYDIENVMEFCYLGHTIYTTDGTFTDLRRASALSKFHEMTSILKDGEINMPTRRKILEASVRSRLVYATQAWWPSEAELKKLESCWYGCLRKMIRGGYRKKKDDDGEESFAFVYTNSDIQNIVKTPPLRDFIAVQYLSYFAHICRKENDDPTKRALFFIPKAKYYRDAWVKISSLLGGISKSQCQRETQSRPGFRNLLRINFPYLKED